MGRPRNFSCDEVLQKAMPVFGKHGFADATLQDLEQATDVNKCCTSSSVTRKIFLWRAFATILRAKGRGSNYQCRKANQG